MPSSDAMLVERLPRDRSGDELRELYRRYAGELFGFASSALGDREQAEEVVQDVFAQLWRHARDYAHRRAAARPKRAEDGSLDSAAEIDASLDQAVLRWQITAALARLSPAHREVIRLAHYGGLTMREIAERTGIPLGTVKSRTSYALRSLRLILDEMEVVP